MDGQINDHHGNLFHPTKDQARLYKAGWRICEKKRMGVFKIVRWVNPADGSVWSQGDALRVLKGRMI
jgi:hypothetical protein